MKKICSLLLCAALLLTISLSGCGNVPASPAAEPASEVRAFKRAKPALTAIEEGEVPDVVFSDIELPGIDGLDLARPRSCS